MWPTKKQVIIGIPLIFLLAVFAYLRDPATGPIFPCIFNLVTGLYCPGCGMTRAVHSLMHFNLYQAIRYNMLIILLPPLFAVYFILTYKRKKAYAHIIINIMLALAILYGIARNIPAFSFLQPTTLN